MNFYKHHIGDYAQATAHLSFVEDAAFSRCLRKYYAEESPLPVDVKAVQRLIGARTRDEKDAVQTVLEEFFELRDDGWHNKRADEELGKANAQAEVNRRTALEREERRRARKEHESSTGSLHESSTNRLEVVNLARHQTERKGRAQIRRWLTRRPSRARLTPIPARARQGRALIRPTSTATARPQPEPSAAPCARPGCSRRTPAIPGC